MSRVGWNPSWFPDYRDYGSLSTGIWSLRWLFLYLRSYNLVGSVTAGIRARFDTKHAICVFKTKVFVKILNWILSIASGHISYAQIRTLRWLIKVLTWGITACFCFVVHTACYCMDAIRLGGNVWLKIPLRSDKWELWEHDRPTVGLGESSCGCSHTYMFNHVSMRVLKCGYLWRVAVILEYMHQGMYVWKYLVYCLLLCILGNY